MFNLQQKELLNDLINGNAMGRRVGNVDVVEFQKRDLLRSHILFILKEQERQRTAQEVYKVIEAELPPDPDTFPNGQKREQCRLMGQLVVTHMAHNCTRLSRQHGSQCQKGLPKDYSEVTHLDDDAFNPIHKRQHPEERGRAVVVRNTIIDNSWIVSHYPYQLFM